MSDFIRVLSYFLLLGFAGLAPPPILLLSSFQGLADMLLCLKFKSEHAIDMKGSQVVYCGMKERLHENSVLESLMSDLFARSILSLSLQNKVACQASGCPDHHHKTIDLLYERFHAEQYSRSPLSLPDAE